MKKLFYLLIFIFVYQNAKATHNMSGDISFTHISGYTYKFTIRTFTNTISTTADRCELYLDLGNGDSITLPRINGPSVLCAPANDGVIINSCSGNIKFSVYEGIYLFSGPGTYICTMMDPNMSPGICNIPNSVNQVFTLQTTLVINPFFASNNSAHYISQPITCDTIGIISNYYPLATDADGDSLFYELDTPSIGYTHPTASSSFSINSSTGIVTWNAPVNICAYVYLIKVSEYKKLIGSSAYYFIGTTMQEVWSIVSNSTSISELNYQNISMEIFPNPADNIITINIDASITQNKTIEIKNILGQTIKSINCSELSTNKNSMKIDIHSIPSGVYFAQVQLENKLISTKFIKH